jgi:hypothetical protein
VFPVFLPFRPSFFRPPGEPITPDVFSVHDALVTPRITSHVTSFSISYRNVEAEEQHWPGSPTPA